MDVAVMADVAAITETRRTTAPSVPRVGHGKLWACGASASVAVAATFSGHEVSALCLLVITVAIALCGRRSVLATVPLAFLSVLFATIVAWSVVAWCGSALFSSMTAARVWLVCLTAAALVVAVRRQKEIAAADMATRSELVAGLPAAVLSGCGLLTAVRPVAVGSYWFLVGADSISHLRLATALRSAGSLDYSADVYPRGWHAVVATLMSATGRPAGNPDTLLAYIRLSALATWGLYVLLVLATALCAQRLARTINLPERTTALVGAGAGAIMLTGSFFTFTMGMGFQTTILLAFLLMVTVLEVGDALSLRRAYVTASLSFVAVAHTWQMALLIAVLPWAGTVWKQWTACPRTSRRAGLVASCLLAVVLAFPPMWAAATQLGLHHAAAFGGIGRLPIEWLLVGTVAVGVCHRSAPRPLLPAALLSAMAVSAVATGVIVAVAVHTPLTSYYPTKLFWQAAVFAVPLAAVAIALVLSTATRPRAGQVSALRRAVCIVVAGSFGAIATFTPVAATVGQWSGDVKDTLAAVTQPEARHALVAWKVTPNSAGDALALMLLDFYSPGSGRAWTPSNMSLADECARLRESPDPAVLTTASQSEVSRHFSCAAGVRAIEADVERR